MLNIAILPEVNTIIEFVVGTVTIGGLLYSLWKTIMRPLNKISKKMDAFESAIDNINTTVVPVITSLNVEFSRNGGKSLMDRILRIDDNTRLAELRSKLIASNLLSTAIFEFGKSGELTWANTAFVNCIGLDIDNILGNGWFVAIEEESRTRVWDLWKHSISSGIPFESEFAIKNQKDGTSTEVKCVVYPHKSVDIGPDGRPIVLGYYGTLSLI